VCSSDLLFRSAYVYLPNLKGWKREGPPPTPEPGDVTKLMGTLKADNASPIRGELTAGTGSAATPYIIIPDGQGGYKPVRKAF
jgi:hypothetical protein